MQTFLRSIVTAVVFGFLSFLGSISILMQIGLSRYDNYEYYGNLWPLYVVPGLVGFVFPSIVAWLLRRSKDNEDLTPKE